MTPLVEGLPALEAEGLVKADVAEYTDVEMLKEELNSLFGSTKLKRRTKIVKPNEAKQKGR